MKNTGTKNGFVVKIPEKPKFQGLDRLLRGECSWEQGLRVERSNKEIESLTDRALLLYDIVSSVRRLTSDNDKVIHCFFEGGEIRLDVLGGYIALCEYRANVYNDYLSQIVMEKVRDEYKRRIGSKLRNVPYVEANLP